MDSGHDLTPPGKPQATGALVCGLIALILEVFGFFIPYVTPIIGLILGIVAVVMASNSAKAGYTGSSRTAGMVLGVLGIVFGAIMLIENMTCTALCAC